MSLRHPFMEYAFFGPILQECQFVADVPNFTMEAQKKRCFWGIDCPETNQDFGTNAKPMTWFLVFAKVVEGEHVTFDRYDRTVALVRVGDTVVNEELIRQGLARGSTGYRGGA